MLRLLYRGEIDLDLSRSVFPIWFQGDKCLILKAESEFRKESWRTPGRLKQCFVDLDGATLEAKEIAFDKQILIYRGIENLRWELQLEPVSWIQDLFITLWESDMPISSLNLNALSQAEDIILTTATVTTTASKIVTGSPDNKSISIANKGNQAVYLYKNNTVSALVNLVEIPKNSLYEFPASYSGDVWAVASSGSGSQVLEIKVFV